MNDEHDPEYELVIPFVVTDDNGGPYEANAFVAGVQYGCIHECLKQGKDWHGYVKTNLISQLDLLAMHVNADLVIGLDANEWTWVDLTLRKKTWQSADVPRPGEPITDLLEPETRSTFDALKNLWRRS